MLVVLAILGVFGGILSAEMGVAWRLVVDDEGGRR